MKTSVALNSETSRDLEFGDYSIAQILPILLLLAAWGLAAFAAGAPSLAWSVGSVLLTVYVVSEGTGRYRVVIQPPIEGDRSLSRKQ